MSTENLYASSITSGSIAGDTSNAYIGAPNAAFTNNGTAAGSWTARFGMNNPVGNVANGTHTVTLRVRKIAGQSGTPAVTSIALYNGATLIQTISAGSVNVTSTTGIDVSATFAASFLNFPFADAEIQVVTTAAGGSGSAKTPIQIDAITWSGDFTTASVPNAGSASGAISWIGSSTGKKIAAGSASGVCAYAGSATGTSPHGGSASGAVGWGGSATGIAPSSVKQGSASGTISWGGSAIGSTAKSGGASGAVSWGGSATGAKQPSGSISGAISWVGSATGSKSPVGSTSGAVGWAGTATGQSQSIAGSGGSASGSISWAGVATGSKSPAGSTAGAIDWPGSAIGVRLPYGQAIAALTWAGTASGWVQTPLTPASSRTAHINHEGRIANPSYQERTSRA